MTLDDIKKKIANEPTKTILTANGFNMNIGLDTSYKTIVDTMLADELPDCFKAVFKDHHYNVEAVMDSINANEDFVKHYATKAIKRDFIKALVHIVKEFDNHNKEGTDKAVKILNGFNNFFTLNFDTFLYGKLLKNAKATFSTKDYSAIQHAFDTVLKQLIKENPIIHLEKAEEVVDVEFNKVSQTHQANVIKYHINDEWKNSGKLKKGLGDVLKNRIHKQEEVDENHTPLNDGFDKDLWVDSTVKKANLYFLHGALHLYEEAEPTQPVTKGNLLFEIDEPSSTTHKKTRKITASQEKNLIADIVERWDDEQMLCLLKGDNKKEYVENHPYLADCSLRLSHLNGALVVIGVSFADNDLYLLEAINQSAITALYIFDHLGTSLNREAITKKLPNEKIEVIFFSTL